MTIDITCLSDLHGHYPCLDGGDLLIVAGDLTARDAREELEKFIDWLDHQEYRKKIFIGGNHDNTLFKLSHAPVWNSYDITYLYDSGTEFEGLKIWGSPWSLTFPGMNPHCKAFTVDTEGELAKKWALIPDDIDILVTHSPPYGILDKTINRKRVGSKSLQIECLKLKKLKLWVVAHIHEAYGIEPDGHLYDCKIVNASHVNEYYQPVNNPIRIEL